MTPSSNRAIAPSPADLGQECVAPERQWNDWRAQPPLAARGWGMFVGPAATEATFVQAPFDRVD
jgi:hypothetical protein